MRTRHIIETILFLSIALAIVAASSAFASEQEHEGGFPVGQVIAAVVNFVLFIAILVKVSKAGVSGYYKNRADELNEAVTKAQAALAEAERLQKDAAERFSNAEKDAEQIIANAREAASRHGEQAIRAAESKSERILADAQAAIAAETKRMTDEMRKELSEKVVEIARNRIAASIDASAQGALIRDYLAKVEEV